MSEQSSVPSSINIDLRPEVTFEAEARAVADEQGKPRLVPLNVGRWNAALGRLAGKGLLRVSISRQKGARSNQQNKYYWSIVLGDYLAGLRAMAADVAMECPFRDAEDLHYHLKHKYIGPTVYRFLDEDVTLDPTTTTLDLEQFSNYVSAIQAEASQRGIYVRQAGEEEAAS